MTTESRNETRGEEVRGVRINTQETVWLLGLEAEEVRGMSC